MFDYLIVGAGLFGATCARALTDAGRRVLVLEQRDYIGGNCADTEWGGIRYALHGGHIFHTNSRALWQYASRFCDWRQYEHRVKVFYRGTMYSFPPNRMTCQQLGVTFGTPEAEDAIRETFFRGYTEKQWGRALEDVPESITRRIPIRDSWDDRYFADEYQGLPAGGYSAMIANMLDGVPYELGQDYLPARESWDGKARRVIYTGALDALFRYAVGRLEYRGLTFEHRWHDTPDYQGCAAINFTERSLPYTRRMEWRHWWPASGPRTLVTTEYPAHGGEPYYPVGDEANRRLYAEYVRFVPRHMRVGGRLGTYHYWNMDQTIGAALALVKDELNG